MISTGKLLDYKDFRQYSDAFIETGTAAGDGVQRAMDAGFNPVLSCEAARCWFELSRDRFNGNRSAILFFGKSTDVLPAMMQYVGGVSIIFLDAHPAGPTSAGHAEWVEGNTDWNQDSIIKAELKIVLASGLKHVIIIDDVNGLADGHSEQYAQMIGEDYDFNFYDENLSGDLLYKDKILVATPKKLI